MTNFYIHTPQQGESQDYLKACVDKILEHPHVIVDATKLINSEFDSYKLDQYSRNFKLGDGGIISVSEKHPGFCNITISVDHNKDNEEPFIYTAALARSFIRLLLFDMHCKHYEVCTFTI